MKKILMLFLCLLAIFFVSWGIKARTLVEKPREFDDNLNVAKWFETGYTSPDADNTFVLDSTIEDNYIPIMGKENYFYVVDDNGKVIKIRKRVKGIDGKWAWEDVDGNTDGMKCINKEKNIYETTDANNKKKYVKYIRNKDGSYAFVETDKDGNYKNFKKDASQPDNKHVLEDGSKNLYGLYDDNNVRIGTVEKRKNKDGKYEWVMVDDPKNNKAGNGGVNFKSSIGDKADDTYVETYGDAGEDKPSNGASNKGKTEKKTETYSETKNGYRYTYKVTTTKKYDKNGELLESYSSDPELIAKTPLQAGDTPDKSAIASTLNKEYNRMSQKVSYNTTKANELLSKLNALRKKNGARTLSMDTSSDLYKLACIRAADMALYNHSSTNSPLYGKIEDTVDRFGLDIVNPTQNIASWSNCSASSLNTKFQSTDSSRETRMNNAYGQVAIAIVDKDGMTYVIELFAQ